jgi:3',5'-cyclic AMP phosphodiesterase CpdA
MRLIAQISDLHFGAHEPAVVDALEAKLAELRPHLVVVSGDLTQRARRVQFREADAFLRRLEAHGLPLIVVPGNHDIPLYNVVRRLFAPLGRYCRIVARGRSAFYHDEEIAALGLFSAHGLTIKDGRLTRLQIAQIPRVFGHLPRDVIKLLVTHHPLVPLPDEEGHRDQALRGADRALAAVREAHVHLILAGHNHAASADVGGPKLATDAQVMVVQAGTATSWRRRGTPNSFNLLRITQGRLTLDQLDAANGAFAVTRSRSFALGDDGWRSA